MVVLFWGQNTCVAKGNEKARLVQGLHPENLAWIPRTMVWKRYLLPLSIKYGYSGYRLDFRGVHAGQAPSTWNASACGPLEAQLPQRALQQAFGGAWSWSQVMKTESRTFNLMLGDVVFHKGSLLSKMYGALPGIPQQCPTPNLTIFLSPKQHDLAGIHHCHLVLSRSEQEKMRQYEFEGHSGSWVERCSKSLLGWFQIRRDRQLMTCQHVSTALDLLNLLILVFFFFESWRSSKQPLKKAVWGDTPQMFQHSTSLTLGSFDPSPIMLRAWKRQSDWQPDWQRQRQRQWRSGKYPQWPDRTPLGAGNGKAKSWLIVGCLI